MILNVGYYKNNPGRSNLTNKNIILPSLSKFEQVWASLSKSEQVEARLYKLKQVWTRLSMTELD